VKSLPILLALCVAFFLAGSARAGPDPHPSAKGKRVTFVAYTYWTTGTFTYPGGYTRTVRVRCRVSRSGRESCAVVVPLGFSDGGGGDVCQTPSPMCNGPIFCEPSTLGATAYNLNGYGHWWRCQWSYGFTGQWTPGWGWRSGCVNDWTLCTSWVVYRW
jgi:hypothetical protein